MPPKQRHSVRSDHANNSASPCKKGRRRKSASQTRCHVTIIPGGLLATRQHADTSLTSHTNRSGQTTAEITFAADHSMEADHMSVSSILKGINLSGFSDRGPFYHPAPHIICLI